MLRLGCDLPLLLGLMLRHGFDLLLSFGAPMLRLGFDLPSSSGTPMLRLRFD